MSISTLKRQHMSNNYIQRCSFSLVIRNIESLTKLSVGVDVEQWNAHITVAGVQTGAITVKSVQHFLIKLKLLIPPYPTIFILATHKWKKMTKGKQIIVTKVRMMVGSRRRQIELGYEQGGII